MKTNNLSLANPVKLNVYEVVTERILASLAAGVAPWKSPYLCGVGFPVNFSTKNEYRGVNVFLLGLSGFSSPFWLTFRQAQELGGNVRRGENGSMVVKYGTFEPDDEEEEKRMFLKTYTVFNACQIEGIEFPKPEARPAVSDVCGEAKLIVAGMPQRPTIKHGSAQAYYRPSEDFVSMPEPENMATEEAYFSTLFHELTHSTGHASRLARKTLMENRGMHSHGTTYAEEELVAEMGAAFLSAHAGIFETEAENSTAYLANWARALKEDRTISVIRAASQAQKAADFILNKKEAA